MSQEILLEKVYAHPPERVWQALTDPKALAQWLMANDFQPRVGHRFQFRDKPRPGWRGIVDCEVLEVDAPRRLAYTWQGDPDGPKTIVVFTLEPAEGGTRLRLQHSGFTGIKGFFLKLILGSGWKSKMLKTRLPQVLDMLRDGTPLPDVPPGGACRMP